MHKFGKSFENVPFLCRRKRPTRQPTLDRVPDNVFGIDHRRGCCLEFHVKETGGGGGGGSAFVTVLLGVFATVLVGLVFDDGVFQIFAQC